MLRFLLVLALFNVALSDVLEFRPCPDSDASVGELVEVSSPDFVAGEDIILHSQQSYSFGMKFYAGYDSPTLVPKIFAMINGVPAPWNGAGSNACANLVNGDGCPLVTDGYYEYQATLTVPVVGNLNNIEFQWALKDTATGPSQLCFRMTVSISSS